MFVDPLEAELEGGHRPGIDRGPVDLECAQFSAGRSCAFEDRDLMTAAREIDRSGVLRR